MRWLTLPILAVFGWFLYTLTPFWALTRLAEAVQRGDVAAVERRVNFRTLRFSIVRQATATLRSSIAADPTLEPRERQVLSDAALGVAMALVETRVTPQTVVDLLDDGWPEGAEATRPAGYGAGDVALGLRVPDLRRLVAYYLTSEMRGFRTVVVIVPPEAPRAQQIRLRLRLRGWTWRLIDIEAPEELRTQMVEKLRRTLTKRYGDLPTFDADGVKPVPAPGPDR